MSLYRRVSNYLMGYKRPPFTLYRLPRKRTHVLKFLFSEGTQATDRWGWFANQNTSKNSFFRDSNDLQIISVSCEREQSNRLNSFKSKKNKDAVLIISHNKTPNEWIIAGFNDTGKFKSVLINNSKNIISEELKREARNESEIFELVSSKLGRSSRAYYLWPDAMRWHFFIFSLVMALPLVANGTLSGVLFSAFLFLLISVILPLIVFYVFRIPVLDYLHNQLPTTTKNRIRKSVEEKTLLNIGHPFSLFKEKWDQVYYSSMGSFQESLLRIALLDMYKKQPTEDRNTVWYSRAFIRWIFYWCSPVWGSFLFLVLISFVVAYLDACSTLQNNLVYSCILWVGSSVFFIKKIAADQFSWTIFSQNHSRYLPSVLVGKTFEESLIVKEISKKNVSMLISIISGFLATTYISSIKFFIFSP